MSSTDNIKFAKLRDIAMAQPGYLSRKSVCPAPSGIYRLLQAKDVSPQAGLCLDNAVRFLPERNPDLYRISHGDILLVARGQEHRAYLVDMDMADVLASNVFYIIRPYKELAVPGYLVWWLNQPDTQAVLATASCGTGIGYLARPSLEELSVAVPPLALQRQIVEVMSLWRRQRSILAQLDQKNEQLIQVICRRAIGLNKE